MTVGRICTRKTHVARADESVRAAAGRMREGHVGTLVAVDDDGCPSGILTDRDLAVRVVADGLDASRIRVEEVMTAHPRWVQEGTAIEDALALMQRLGVRRLPVVDESEKLVGIVSADDVLELVSEEISDLGRIVGASQAGAGPPVTIVPEPPSARRSRDQRATTGQER